MSTAGRALRRLGFRQTLRGAVILGVIVGMLMGVQGLAYAKAFPDQASRQKLVASLESVSGVNFLSGEIANAAEPDSYAIYKSLAMTVIITGVWGLVGTTRLLRGYEEDGQMELLSAGTVTKRQASGQLLIGFAGSFLIACAIAFILIAALGASPTVQLSPAAAALTVAAVFLPAVFFAALGVLTSQLALTRGRAIAYGLVPLLIFYVIRGSANSVSDVDWLKRYTPFGWSDLLNPVLGRHTVWILPSLLFAIAFVILGLLWAGDRDLGTALIRQSDEVKPHFGMLRSPLAFAFRQNRWNFAGWGIGVAAFAAFFAALANVSVKLINDSSAAHRVIASGTIGEDKIKLAFIGVATMFVTTTLLVMATLHLAKIRREEAKGYLDNLLVQPTPRTRWLVGRLLLIAAAFTAFSLLAGLVAWVVAHHNHIALSFGTEMEGAISVVGSLAVTLGIGAFFYGFWPRLGVAAMAVFIGWAFVVDILKSFFDLNEIFTKTSFLTYVPVNPTKGPDWTAFVWMVAIGLALAICGVSRFAKRDIINE